MTGEATSLDSLKEMAPVLEETARIIYSNNTITVNIIWAGLAVAAGLACEYQYPLCGLNHTIKQIIFCPSSSILLRNEMRRDKRFD